MHTQRWLALCHLPKLSQTLSPLHRQATRHHRGKCHYLKGLLDLKEYVLRHTVGDISGRGCVI